MSGIGLILIGFALVALSRPYMEMAADGDVPPPPPKRWPLKRKALQIGRRTGAHLRLGFGQILGLAAIVAGIIVMLH